MNTSGERTLKNKNLVCYSCNKTGSWKIKDSKNSIYYCSINCFKNISKKRPKYGQIKKDGYDSKLEHKHATELKILAKNGKISNLKEQVKINIEVYNPYINNWEQLNRRYCRIDFVFEVDGKTILYESKGYLDKNMAQSIKYQLLQYMIDSGRLKNHILIIEKTRDISSLNKLLYKA